MASDANEGNTETLTNKKQLIFNNNTTATATQNSQEEKGN